MKKVTLFALLVFGVLLYLPNVAFGQQFQLKGKVRSTESGSLPGVNIQIVGTTEGTFTDGEGNFKLKVSLGDTLRFSYIGFNAKKITVKDRNSLDVRLEPKENSLNEMTVTGYGGEVNRITNTGSVSSIKASKIENVPTPNIQNALTGKLPGYFSQQRSGQPGRSAADFYIRGISSLNGQGNRPLIIVDDVEYTYKQLQQIDVNEIESVSILKDASSTAIYGIKGANGVLVVKTKRGEEGKPRVSARVQTGIQAPTEVPQFLDSYHTALLVNEAYENDGLQPKFSEKDLKLFKNGNDPYGHPDVNWYDKVFKNYASQTKANFDMSGGSENLQYFVSAGALSQNGLVNSFEDPRNKVNTNYFYRRFNFRSNLDYQVTEDLSLRLDMTTRFGNINEPNSLNAVSEIYDFTKIHPYSAPFLNPNGSYAYAFDTEGHLPTINARLANRGYRRTRRTDSNILLQAREDLHDITKGLSVKGRLAYANIKQNYRRLFRGGNIPAYHFYSSDSSYVLGPNSDYVLGTYANTGGTDQYTKRLNLQGYLQYDRTFSDDHHVTGLLVYNKETSTAESRVPDNFRGLTMKLGYDYKDKYLLDINGAYNGTDRFKSDKRYGFFPAASVGWNISNEPFFKRNVSFVQLLKLRTSYGLVGSDAAGGGRYLYAHKFYEGGGYSFGENDTPEGGVYEGQLANRNVTWEKVKKFDVGIDLNMFENKFSLTLDYFYNKRYDQLITRGGTPEILGIGIAPTNIGVTQNQGWDGKISYQDRVGEINYHTNLVFSFARNKILYLDEPKPAFSYLSRIGLPINQPFGYTFNGFYSKEDIAKNNDNNPDNDVPTVQGTNTTRPGDLKYKDLNGDGVISENDRSPIGKPNLPNTTGGLTLGANYKGFSVNILFQGSFDYSFSVKGTGVEPFKSQFQPVHQDRWTPQNSEDPSFPRLTTNPNTVNSPGAYMSDFWLIDAWYIRFKTLDMGYQLPAKWLPFGIDNARFFVSGYNLFTFTNYDKYQQDPESASNSPGTAYFNQRVLNFGVDVGF